MKLIVGLGNPGADYEQTRHNIGWMVLDKLARELSASTMSWSEDVKRQAYVAKVSDVILVKPLTFMNQSGQAVRKLIDYYTIDPADVMVVHDDMDLPIGKIRIRLGGSSAGHNGVDSIIHALGTDKFVRFRLGVGRGKEALGLNANKHLRHRSVISFVLSKFNLHEAGEHRHLVKNGAEAIRIVLTEGLDKAMNRFN